MSEPGNTPPPLSVRAYARHRKALGLNGGSAPAVLKAIDRGRLKLSLVREEDGTAKIADVALADREWAQNTDLSRAPGDVKERGSKPTPPAVTPPGPPPPPPPKLPAPPPPSATEDTAGFAQSNEKKKPELPELDPDARWNLNDASAEEKKWKALKAELEYKEKLGELVPAKDVEAATTTLFTTIRTKLLAVPVKARAQSPHWSLTDVHLIDRLLREALEELATSEPGTAPSAPAAA